MSIPQAKLREVLFLFLYAQEITHVDNSYELSEMVMDELKIARSVARQMKQQAEIIAGYREKIDEELSSILNEYRLDRLQTVERAILRLAVYELLMSGTDSTEEGARRKLPPKIVIAEAKRLVKKFATPQAASFIHAVIAAVAKKHALLDELSLETSIHSLPKSLEVLEATMREEEEIIKAEGLVLPSQNSLQLELD